MDTARNVTGAPAGGEVTRLLARIRESPETFDRVIALVYEDLKRIAHTQRARFNAKLGPTLQTTALVHEAFLKLRAGAERSIANRRHFQHLASKVMRQLVLDHARKQFAVKRGGEWVRADVPVERVGAAVDEDFVLALEVALRRLEAADPRQAEIVAASVYAGYTAAEIAEMLSVSESTVVRELRKARAFLTVELGRER